MSRYLGAAPGFLVAVDLPPGPAWLEVVEDLWEAETAILPLDPRLTDRERRTIVDLARPASVVTIGDEVLFADPAPPQPGHLGLVVATSGTGGGPKLVELSRSAITAALELSFTALAPFAGGAALERSERWVCCLSPAHIGGMLVLMRHVVTGAPVTVLDRLGLDPLGSIDPLEAMPDVPVGAHVALVPTMLRRLVAAGTDLSRFGILLVGGAELDAGLAQQATAQGGRIVSTYGLTETCGGIAYDERLFDGTRARIAADGGIELLGPTIMLGYRHDPAATAAAFTLDGWLRTADAGDVLEDGRLRVDGRADEAIRTGAETVWPQEVEIALRDHPKVLDVAVAGRPHPEWGKQVVAFVVPVAMDDPPGLEELRAHVEGRIARFKSPKAVVLMTDLPRTASGKIRRRELPS
ncbi:MAG: class I adenylate-forming enzyme family protein [Actinomycetota bacterium]